MTPIRAKAFKSIFDGETSKEAMNLRRFVALFVLIAAFVVFPLFGSAIAVAQDATPVATCTAPDLPPGTPTPMEEGSPVAADEGAATAEAPPVEPVEEEASPVSEGPATAEVAAAAQAAFDNALTCIAAGEFLKLAALMTPNFLAFVTETGNPYDVPLSLEGVTPMRIVSQGEALEDQNGRLGLPLIYGDFFNGPGVLSSEVWYFFKDGEIWKIDEIRSVPAPAGFMPEATIVEVQMVDYAFALSQYEIPAGQLSFASQTSRISIPRVLQG